MAAKDQETLRAHETERLIAADKVEGTAVLNRDGVKIGTVDHLMIDKISGKVAYAVMSFGGFLGIGEKYHPLPWGVLDYNTEEGAYMVDLDKDTLERAPQYGRGELPDMNDEAWGREVHDYYGVTYVFRDR